MNSVETDFPRYVGIETINTCNARCPFCSLFQGSAQMSRTSRPAHIMRSEVFDDIIAQLSAWARPPASIFLNMNGEPLQDPDFVERCKILRSSGLGPRIQIQTNGHFIGLSEAEAILDAQIGRLVIGFDGASKSVVRISPCAVRLRAGTWQYQVIRRTPEREDKIDQNRGAVCYVQDKTLVGSSTHGECLATVLDPGPGLFSGRCSEGLGNAPGEEQLYFIPKLSTPLERADCQLAAQQLIINSDGKVQACCWDYNLSVSEGGLGDATSQRLIDIWRSRKRRELLARINADDFRRDRRNAGPAPTMGQRLTRLGSMAGSRRVSAFQHSAWAHLSICVEVQRPRY